MFSALLRAQNSRNGRGIEKESFEEGGENFAESERPRDAPRQKRVSGIFCAAKCEEFVERGG